MDRVPAFHSSKRNNFSYAASIFDSVDDSTGSSRPSFWQDRRQTSPRSYKRYSYLFSEEGTTGTEQRSCKYPERDVWDAFEDSSTEAISKPESSMHTFDPTERRLQMTSELVKSERKDRVSLLMDISRCQVQVEELITLFRSLNRPQPVRESTPKLRQRFKSRIPRSIQVGPRRSVDLEHARANLAQSLQDALALLDRFPRERELIRRSITPSNGVSPSPNELIDAVDRLEQISLAESGDLSDELASTARSLSRRWNTVPRANDRLPILKESLSFSSDPSTTPFELVDNDRMTDPRADNPVGSNLFPNETRQRSDSSFRSLFSNEMESRDSFQPFRVFSQDPIHFGHLTHNSSQSLSGLITAIGLRPQTHFERDAMSDSEIPNSRRDFTLCRRTRSATAALCPTSRIKETVDCDRSIEGSSDWDIVEDGLCLQRNSIDATTSRDEKPGRLSPEAVLWTSMAFSTLEFRSQSRTVDSRLPFTAPELLMSDFSEMRRNISQQHCRIDRSVQCDLSSTVSTKILSKSAGCGLLCKMKGKKRPPLLKRVMLPSSFVSKHTDDDLSTRGHIMCGIRTAVRAALRPPFPHGKRDLRRGCPESLQSEDSNLNQMSPSAG